MAERNTPRIATAALLAALGLAGLLVVLPGPATAGWRTIFDDTHHPGLRGAVQESPRHPSNNPPTAKDATRRIQENGRDLSIDLASLASDDETPDKGLSYRLYKPEPRRGNVTLSGSIATYDVGPDVSGEDEFGYLVQDDGNPQGCGPPGPDCAASDSATGTITIIIERAGPGPRPRPSPSPTASDNPSPSPGPGAQPNRAPSVRTGSETVTGKRPVAIDLADLVRDAETADNHLSFELASPVPAKGEVSLTRSVARYVARLGKVGTDSFGYRVTDRGAPDGCRTESRSCKPPRSTHGLVTIRLSGPSPSPAGPDLVFEEPPTLELVPGAAGDAVTDRSIIVLAATPESLKLSAVVANVGEAGAPATSIVIASDGWIAPRAPVPSILAGDARPIVFVTPAPDGVSEDTEFTISIESVEGEKDHDNNAAKVLVKAEGSSSPTTAIVTLALIALVAAVGLTSFLRVRKMPRVSPRARSSRQRRQQLRIKTEGLADLADRYLGRGPASPLWLAGPNARLFREALEDDDLATSYLATVYWRTLLGTHAYSNAMVAAGASPAAIERPEVLVISHAGGTRCDLVLLDRSFSLSEPSGTPIELSTEELSDAWAQVPHLRMPASALGMADLARAMEEVHSFEKFGLVVAPKPEIVLLHSPSPAWAVAHEDEEPTSTAGVAVINGEGRKGVTVAYHAVQGREKVWVNRSVGEVVSSDPISDSAFVVVDHALPASVRGGKGPLSGMSPRQMEVVEFDGIRSGKATTRVVGWDPTILTMESYIQNKIVTDPVTMPGDSGAALIDGDGHVLGFAFYTTGLNAQPAHSGWIWADSVYRFHDLRRVEG